MCNLINTHTHTHNQGGKMSKRLGGNIIGCKDTSWHFIRFPDGSNIGSTLQCRGETPRHTVCTCIILVAMQVRQNRGGSKSTPGTWI